MDIFCTKIMIILDYGIFLLSSPPCKHLKSYIDEIYVLHIFEGQLRVKFFFILLVDLELAGGALLGLRCEYPTASMCQSRTPWASESQEHYSCQKFQICAKMKPNSLVFPQLNNSISKHHKRKLISPTGLILSLYN